MCHAATAVVMSSRQVNPLGEEERVVTARLLGSSSVGPQGKDRLCSVPSDVACSAGFAEQTQACVKEMLALLGAWTSQVLAFEQALRELMQDLKGVGPWKILKSLGLGHSKMRPWRKTKRKPFSDAP
jgi:hypothetical protein